MSMEETARFSAVSAHFPWSFRDILLSVHGN
jgi:hypothetical protein